MEQMAYATLVEDCERLVDEVGYAEVRVPRTARLR